MEVKADPSLPNTLFASDQEDHQKSWIFRGEINPTWKFSEATKAFNTIRKTVGNSLDITITLKEPYID